MTPFSACKAVPWSLYCTVSSPNAHTEINFAKDRYVIKALSLKTCFCTRYCWQLGRFIFSSGPPKVKSEHNYPQSLLFIDVPLRSIQLLRRCAGNEEGTCSILHNWLYSWFKVHWSLLLIFLNSVPWIRRFQLMLKNLFYHIISLPY